MALNPFFLQGAQSEQRLIQDLINEQLQIYGVEVTYIPRKFVRKQTIIKEVQSSKFDDNFSLEAYVNTYEGYSGAGDVLTKFGVSLRDEVTLTISKERFEDFISPFLDAADDDEIELVKLAARATGTTLVGVDHCIVDGELLVLECNGSPGFGSNYMGYNIKQQTPSESMSNEGIMTNIMKYIQKSNRRKPSFQLESGYIERIEIDGVGPIRAKFDTGNGTKASMFAVDKLEHDGKVARWEYKGKKFKHKVIGISSPEHVTMKETRPIVEIDIKFNNRVYPKTPFGLTAEDAKSTILINRDLLSLFRVAVNPNRKFVLSDYIEKEDKNDT